MAENMTMDDVLIFIDNMKVLELSEFVKRSRRDMVFLRQQLCLWQQPVVLQPVVRQQLQKRRQVLM